MIRPVLKYPGSKWRLAEWIVANLPPHVTYLEPYFGSGAVFFNKPPSHVETVNDIDRQVVNFFRMVRDHGDELARLLELTPWSRTEYYQAYEPTGEPLEDARRFAVRMWMAHGARSSDSGGWRHDITGKGSCARTWQTIPARFRFAALRLKDAQIENQPALQLIERYRQPQVLIYADPPYMLSTRHGRLYANEMKDQDHSDLLDALEAHPGPVVLSGYANDLYDSRLRHWTRKTMKALAEKALIREEVLWINPVAAAAIGGSLFEEVDHAHE